MEYEQFLFEKRIETPTLDQTFSDTKHYLFERRTDWFDRKRVKKRWFKDIKIKEIKPIGEQFYAKRGGIGKFDEYNRKGEKSICREEVIQQILCRYPSSFVRLEGDSL